MFGLKRGPLDSLFRDATGWLWLFSTAVNILMLASPIYMTQVYSHVLPGHGFETLIYLTLLVTAAFAVYGLLESARSIIAQKLSARYELAATHALLEGGLAADAGTDIADAVRQAGVARQVLSSRTFLGLYDLPFAPLYFLVLFFAHPLLGAVALAGGAILVGIAVLNNTALGDTSQRGSAHQSQASRYAAAALNHSEDVRAMGMAPQMIGRWEQQAIAASAAADEAGSVNAYYMGLTRFVRQVLQILMLGIGAYLVLIGQMSAGLIFAASLLSGKALAPIEQMIGGWRQLLQGIAAHEKVSAVLVALEAKAQTPSIELPEPTGRLTLEAVGFDVPEKLGKRALLSEVSMVVEPGEITAVMGPSGAGKSTLARLIAGIAAPTSGHVRLDGFDLAQWPTDQRGAAMGYLGQESELLDGTVAQNIARFAEGVPDLAIITAAQRANAHEFIARLPDGYMTRLGTGGIRLSGGQAQRIGLARALFGEPKLLVLDEPNAHLDSDGERALIDALAAEKARGRAIVVVSQRNSILAVADRVALVRDGRLESCRPARDVFPRAMNSQDGARITAHAANHRRTYTPAQHSQAGDV
ncbi:type I secretion system permease/ATPase [Devosia sp. SL43]|uniref:type I secretion system permease/ATPase n=1 Tax=Devosia sp. SL43 TaxID=2806348 RepID=UPI001EFFD24B|nr:type I secretion system permease/ATPase [Devosia sp. SL43]UJW85361.1 type I secretion system permease/ATPase [Devosia sp. SL43]